MGLFAVMVVQVVWLVCAPPFCPRFPLSLALSHGGERGSWRRMGLFVVMGVLVVWCGVRPSAPGIPRSHRCARSRSFRVAKGAWVSCVGLLLRGRPAALAS